MISPATFIPVSEDSGLITEMGRWVLEEACRQQHIWCEMGMPLRMAVNVSARQMLDEELLGFGYSSLSYLKQTC